MEVTTIGIDLAKECVRGVRCGEQRASGNAPATATLNFTITRSEPRVSPKPGPTLYSIPFGARPAARGRCNAAVCEENRWRQ